MTRLAVTLLCLTLFVAPLAAAQPPGKPFRVGVLGDFRPSEQWWAALVLRIA